MEKAVRSSNFELLRIVAMLFILLFHIQIHGSQIHLNEGLFSTPQIYKSLLIFEIGIPLGMVGNALFMMISGYFLIDSAYIDIAKISKKLLLQAGYATIILTIASAIVVTYYQTCIRYAKTSGNEPV